MSVSYHIHSMRNDPVDVERAAGRLRIASKSASEQRLSDALLGASIALRAMVDYDIRTEEDMLTVWSMLWSKEVPDDGD